MTASRLEEEFPDGVVVVEALDDPLDEGADGLAVLQHRVARLEGGDVLGVEGAEEELRVGVRGEQLHEGGAADLQRFVLFTHTHKS